MAKAEKPYTPALLRKFDRLTAKLSSPRQMDRIDARVVEVPAFVEKHGKDVCDAMFEELQRRDAKKKRRHE